MEYSFSSEELVNAIEYLDQHPEEFKGRESSTYDLVYEGKKYPPILVLSKANELKGGKELLLKDFKNSTEKAFKYLIENGFHVIPKVEQMVNIQEFIEVANSQVIGQGTNSEATNFIRKSKGAYKKLAVEISYGVGRSTAIPWIAFLGNQQKVKEGIYPVFLYYKEHNILVLAYGVSETNEPTLKWDKLDSKTSIKDYFKEELDIKLKSYGNSYVFKVYDATNLPSQDTLKRDLDLLIEEYLELMNRDSKQHSSIEKSMIKNKDFDINAFSNSLTKSNLQFNNKLVQRFVASLLTKPFVILTGLAGSGKTKLAQSFIQWMCEREEQYKLVAVGADWINREPLLGYPNGLKEDEYVMPDNGVLQLMINASKSENQDKPYFLVLDEMNLSHVERYFADFLSIMESEDSIKLYTGSKRTSTNDLEIPQTISWPKNLFIIGTVNIDETTYMFSPKVLDRANVIEFRLDEDDLKVFLAEPKKVDLSQLISEGAAMASSFITLSKQNDTASNEVLNETLVEFFKELKTIGAEFGYRTAFEIHLLFAQFSKLDSSLSEEDKIDFAVMQKLLPKLHGSRSKIIKSLEALMRLCLKDAAEFNLSKLDALQEDQIKYNVSFDKLKRMYANALSNGFTSYAEA
ncbi:McrB family protein [Empedobacter tilapiae]|uniref:DUF3578 domain-containing protein n=1 Tax=Empedobacter tilapiae TaxID=2491114 RepID=A0A4Z1B0A8_9FLAO|nr:DUF3578 domain-containing protein [Empedobacter tilapiae]TGN26463.1 DUF3578 domain-containing protein [Empedobacter tilapiae]